MITVKWPAESVSGWAEQAQERMQEFADEFVQELGNQILKATPVDTGYLRAAWQLPTGVKLGETYHANNTANYAGFVEFGTRKMTPRAFVRGTIARAQEIADIVLARMVK